MNCGLDLKLKVQLGKCYHLQIQVLGDGSLQERGGWGVRCLILKERPLHGDPKCWWCTVVQVGPGSKCPVTTCALPVCVMAPPPPVHLPMSTPPPCPPPVPLPMSSPHPPSPCPPPPCPPPPMSTSPMSTHHHHHPSTSPVHLPPPPHVHLHLVSVLGCGVSWYQCWGVGYHGISVGVWGMVSVLGCMVLVLGCILYIVVWYQCWGVWYQCWGVGYHHWGVYIYSCMVCVLFQDKPSGQCLYFTNPVFSHCSHPSLLRIERKPLIRWVGWGSENRW